MITKSNSQSGQDRFVDLILEGKRDGIFVDIGANHPVELSNTYALEKELGWRGALVERDEHCLNLLRMNRNPRSAVVPVDALTANWTHIADLALDGKMRNGPWVIDYLSLDCDENTASILDRLMDHVAPLRFRVLTIETDFYRFGPEVRDRIDLCLANHGYDIICKNVRASDGSIYETWAVDPKLVNMKVAEKFRSNHLKWSEILARA